MSDRPEPGGGEPGPSLSAVMVERRALINLAYRLLGSLADAEDAVQETYARWFAMAAEQRDAVASPGAWLTTVTSRICLDLLGSARVRRERYVGEWVPEPLPEPSEWPGGRVGASALDPADRVTLDESVGMAFLVVLDSMTPAERVAFILHDVFCYPFAEVAEISGRSPGACRQLAASARRRTRTSGALGSVGNPPARQAGSLGRSSAWVVTEKSRWLVVVGGLTFDFATGSNSQAEGADHDRHGLVAHALPDVLHRLGYADGGYHSRVRDGRAVVEIGEFHPTGLSNHPASLQAFQQAQQRATLGGGQPGEDRGLDVVEDEVEAFEQAAAGGGQLDEGLAAVTRVGPAPDQLACLEAAHRLSHVPAVKDGGAPEIGLGDRPEVTERGEDSIVVAARSCPCQALVQHPVCASRCLGELPGRQVLQPRRGARGHKFSLSLAPPTS